MVTRTTDKSPTRNLVGEQLHASYTCHPPGIPIIPMYSRLIFHRMSLGAVEWYPDRAYLGCLVLSNRDGLSLSPLLLET
jgi:hypothetical protein